MRLLGRIWLIVALAMFAGACTNDPGPPAGTPTSPVAVDTETPDATEAFALWPEDTRAAAEAKAGDPEPYRADRGETALRFASQVLGWDDAISTPYDGAIECGESGCVVLTRPSGETVLLTMGQLVEDLWSVRGVGDPEGGEESLGLDISSDKVRAVFPLGDAASAEFEIGYNGEVQTREYTKDADAEQWDLDLDRTTSGHFLIQFKDAQGQTIRALGSPLPAGDFVAG